MIPFVASIVFILLIGGFSAQGERSRTPIVPAPAGDLVPHSLDDGPG